MLSPGADAEHLLARLTAVNLVLQGLLERLALSGIIDRRDLEGIRRFALDITEDLQAHGATGAQVGGARAMREVESFFQAMGME